MTEGIQVGHRDLALGDGMRNGRPRLRPADSSRRSPQRKHRLSIFWEVFGATLISIVALLVVTGYNQLTTAEADLRRDVHETQRDFVKKDEFNMRLTAVWNSIKDLQMTDKALGGLTEQAKMLAQHVGTQMAAAQTNRSELQKSIEELNCRLQTLAERLAAIEGGRSRP